MNKSFQLFLIFIFLLPVCLSAQNTSAPKDTLRSLNAGDLEDDFAASFEKTPRIIIIEQNNDVLVPKSYEQKEKQFFYEQEPEMQNDNFAIIDLPEGYTGFKVEIVKVMDQPLPDDDIIFFRHGNVVEEMLDENTFAYAIGDFKTEEKASEFLETFLLELYPEARVIPYVDGKRE